MLLSSMLKLPGGVPEQGHEVVIRLRSTGADRVPCYRDIRAVLLPLSEPEMQVARRTARQAAEQDSAPLPLGEEEIVQLLQVSLRNPDNPGERLIQGDLDLKALRDGLVGPQYDVLYGEYKKLIAEQYPDEVSQQQELELERQARDFSGGDQPGRG